MQPKLSRDASAQRGTGRRVFFASARIAVAIIAAALTWWLCGEFVERISWSDYKLDLEASSVQAKNQQSFFAPDSITGENLRRVSCLPSDVSSGKTVSIPGSVPYDCHVVVSGPAENIQDQGAALARAKSWIYEVASPVPGYSPEMFDFGFSVSSVIAWTSIPSGLFTSVLLIAVCFLLAWSVGFRPLSRHDNDRGSPWKNYGNVALTFVPVTLVFAATLLFDTGRLNSTGPVSGTDILTVVLLRPIAEELFYRVWMIDWLGREVPAWLAVVISAAIFFFGHDPSSILSGTAMIVCGALFGLIWVRSRSLTLCVIAHGLVNAVITYTQ